MVDNLVHSQVALEGGRQGGSVEQHPIPSKRARELVAGAYDAHVHVAPDVVPRLVDDLTLAKRFRDRGLRGFVLKSHYVPTGERAAVVRAAVPGVDVLGGIVLNVPVGGLNPVAVEIAGRTGARVVWFPTVDGVNQRTSRAKAPAGAKPPMWAALQQELRDEGVDPPPVEVVGEDGRANQATLDVLRVIAKHDMALATGHLSGTEIRAVVEAAAEVGVRRIIVTHPEFTTQRLTAAEQSELADMGAVMERCFTTAYTGKVDWQVMVDNIRTVGPENSFLSSDLGQPDNPPVEDGIALMADDLLRAGFTEDEVHTMAVENTIRLVKATESVGQVTR
jgi:hypothetical protein